jgi:hypothetical protein
MINNYCGNIYGHIEVLKKTDKRKRGYVVYKCRCNKCGKVFENSLESYRKRFKLGINTMTCGCYDPHYNNFYKNGLSNTRLRHIYDNMKSRCLNQKNKGYKNYGGRGINVCDEWLDSKNGFENFYNWSMNNGYAESLSIDRIDVNGDYEPSNCRWATYQEQMTNRTNTILLKYKKIEKPLTEWAREYKIPIVTLRSRITRGWSVERALKEKVHANYKGKHNMKFLKYNNMEKD